MAEREYSLKTVNRAFEVLRAVQDAPRPATLSELAETLGMSTSNVFRFLKTLEASGHIRRADQKTYAAVSGGGGEIGLAQGLALLDHIASVDEDGLERAELADFLGLDEPQVERALAKLEAAGTVERRDGRWRVSNAMVRFLRPILNDRFLDRFVRPILAEVNAETGETVSWYVPRGWEQIVVEVRPSAHALRYVLDTGMRYPLYLGAAGKAQLAEYPEAEVRTYLETLEPEHFTRFRVDKAALLEDLAQTRARGYALSAHERVEGAASVARAVRGPDGTCRGVISVMMPLFRTSEQQMAELGARLNARIAGLYDFDDMGDGEG